MIGTNHLENPMGMLYLAGPGGGDRSVLYLKVTLVLFCFDLFLFGGILF